MLGTKGWGLALVALAGALVTAACGGDDAPPEPAPQDRGTARFSWRPEAPTNPATETGAILFPPSGTAPQFDAYVPTTYTPGTPHPLLLLLHGAGGTGARLLPGFTALAEERGLILVAPRSTAATWDVIATGKYGADLRVLYNALSRVTARYDVDPARLTIGGFSDGATYALSVGLTNGDLFRRIVAFSPGFMVPSEYVALPPVFLSHGRQDAVLSFETSGKAIADDLTRRGYPVTFVPFDGGHEMPEAIRAQGLDHAVAQ